ncbi:MFS transporter [Streptomyces palmae]|uniref:MFS transporter n=2 Tax=Streptomyces palmae TaxID=1701085 RepID=A0A4Z0GN73_9ACTN|nr:MFS transporter [Streptomyces palmae]
MLGIFAIVTTEILPIGLLTPIASTFHVSDGTAGLMMTMPGFLAAVAAPTLTIATARVDRRLMLAVLMALLALANFLAAAAPGFWLVLVSRVMVGITIGGFWSIGAGLAERLVPATAVPRATAVIFTAVPLGSVLGVPAGTFIGDHAGWRTAFVAMGALTAVALTLLLVLLPPLPARQATHLAVLRATVRGTDTRYGLAVTFLIVLAHFGTYTYVTPFLQQVTHLRPDTVTLFLLAYGTAGILGNLLGGAFVARHPRGTFAVAATLLAAAALLLPVLGSDPAAALVLLLAWGLAYGSVPVCSQTWFVTSAPGAPEAASVVFTTSFQATLSLGALVGGLVIDRTSPSTVMTLGGVTALLMVATAGIHRARRPGWSTRP